MSVSVIKKPVEYFKPPTVKRDYSTINAVENNVTYLLRRLDDRIVNIVSSISLRNVWELTLNSPIDINAVAVGDYVNIICDQYMYVEQAGEVVLIDVVNNILHVEFSKALLIPTAYLNDVHINYKQNWLLQVQTMIFPNRQSVNAGQSINEQFLTCDSKGYIYLNPAPDVSPYLEAIKDNLGYNTDWRIETKNLLPYLVGFAEQYKGTVPTSYIYIYPLESSIPSYQDYKASMLLAGLPSGNEYDSNMKQQIAQTDILGVNTIGVKPLIKMVSNIVYGFKGVLEIVQLQKEWGLVNGLNDISQLAYTSEVQNFQGTPVASDSNSMVNVDNNVFLRFKPYLSSVAIPLTAIKGYYEIEVDGVTYIKKDYEIKTLCWDSFRAKKQIYIRWLNTLGAFEHHLFDVIDDNQEETNNGEFLAFSPFLKNENVKQKVQQKRQSNLLIASRVKDVDLDAFADLISSDVVQVFEFSEGVEIPEDLVTTDTWWRDIEVLNNAFKKPIKKGETFLISYDINYKRHHPQNKLENSLLPIAGGGLCAPANYTLINSASTPISSGSIASGGSANITAPDSNLVVNGGSPIPIPSGDTYNLTVQGWQRPIEWLPIPNIANNEAVLYGIIAVYENNVNSITFALGMHIGASNFDIIFEDDLGVVQQLLNVPASIFQFEFPWSTVSASTYVANGGYRQVRMKVKPTTATGNAVFGISFSYNDTIYGTNNLNLLDFVGNCRVRNLGGQVQYPTLLQRVKLVNVGSLTMHSTDLQNFLMNTKSLQVLDIPELTYEVSNMTYLFNLSALTEISENVIWKPTGSIGNGFTYANLNIAKVDFGSITTNYANCFQTCFCRKLVGLNMTNLTQSMNLGGSYGVEEIEFNGYKVSHNISQTSINGVNAFTNYANSLGTATTSPTITMRVTQYNSFGGSGSAVESIILGKGFTIMTV